MFIREGKKPQNATAETNATANQWQGGETNLLTQPLSPNHNLQLSALRAEFFERVKNSKRNAQNPRPKANQRRGDETNPFTHTAHH